MINIIKTDIYRITQNKKNIILCILGVLYTILINFLFLNFERDGDVSKITGEKFLNEFFDSEFILLYLSVVITIYCLKSFKDKTVNYEIMYGYKWSQILFSKILVNAIFQILIIMSAQFMTFGICSFINGSGIVSDLLVKVISEILILFYISGIFACISFVFIKLF